MSSPTNTVRLNVGRYASEEPPEPGLAAVFIDGVPIHNVSGVAVSAGSSEYTTVTLTFIAKVGGFVADTKEIECRS